MFSFNKQVLIALIIFSESFATKFLFFSDEPCMARPTFNVLNLFEPKCTGSCNILSPKLCDLKETRQMLTNKMQLR